MPKKKKIMKKVHLKKVKEMEFVKSTTFGTKESCKRQAQTGKFKSSV